MRITLHVKMVVLWLFLSSVSSFAQDTTIEDREAGYRVKLPERAKEGRKNIYTLPNGITFISIEVDQLDLPGKSSRELLDFAVQSAAEIFSDDKKPIGLRFRQISGVLAAEFSTIQDFGNIGGGRLRHVYHHMIVMNGTQRYKLQTNLPLALKEECYRTFELIRSNGEKLDNGSQSPVFDRIPDFHELAIFRTERLSVNSKSDPVKVNDFLIVREDTVYFLQGEWAGSHFLYVPNAGIVDVNADIPSQVEGVKKIMNSELRSELSHGKLRIDGHRLFVTYQYVDQSGAIKEADWEGAYSKDNNGALMSIRVTHSELGGDPVSTFASEAVYIPIPINR